MPINFSDLNGFAPNDKSVPPGTDLDFWFGPSHRSDASMSGFPVIWVARPSAGLNIRNRSPRVGSYS
jgi:hypothetical protein